MLYGGAGSGKSVFAAQKLLVRLLSKNKHRFLMIRKVARTIRNSQFKLFKELISMYNLTPYFDIKENEMNIVCKNGNDIISAGVDDVEKLKSIAGITGVWIEEATELTEQEFDQIDLRLRGETDEYKQIILTFNPVYIGHWLNQRKWDESKVTKLKTTYTDNKFIDPAYKEKLDQLKYTDENYYNIYCLGNWGMIRNAERAYHQFNRENCVVLWTDMPMFKSETELIVSYDFNINPMCAVMYIFHDGVYTQIREWRIDNSNTEELTELVAQHIRSLGIAQSIIVTGDASGRAKGTKGFMSDYEIIQKILAKYDVKFALRIPEANPPVRDRINYVNKMFQTGKLKLSQSCKFSIQDRELVTWKKGSEQFKIDKSQADLTHLSDAADYAIWNTQALVKSDEADNASYLIGGQRRWS